MNTACCVACHYTGEMYCKNKKLKEVEVYIFFLNLHIKLKSGEIFANLILHVELSVQDKCVHNKFVSKVQDYVTLSFDIIITF